MTVEELEEAIDRVILSSGLGADDVAGVLEIMAYRYEEQAAEEPE